MIRYNSLEVSEKLFCHEWMNEWKLYLSVYVYLYGKDSSYRKCSIVFFIKLRCLRNSIPDVSLPPYRIPHQCHQCSSVSRCHNRPLREYTGIQYTGTTLCQQCLQAFSRSRPPPPSPVPRFPPGFPGVKFNSLFTDHRALLSERLG